MLIKLVLYRKLINSSYCLILNFNFFKKILFNLKLKFKNIIFRQYYSLFFKNIKKFSRWSYWYKKKRILNLNFNFVKKNLFFNYIKQDQKKILMSMTLKKAGFTGKLRLKKNSIFSVILILLKQINKKKKIFCALFYKGLIKYKYLIRKIIKINFVFIKILYFKYFFKLAHNGTKKNIKKNRNKQKHKLKFIRKKNY